MEIAFNRIEFFNSASAMKFGLQMSVVQKNRNKKYRCGLKNARFFPMQDQEAYQAEVYVDEVYSEQICEGPVTQNSS